MVEVQKNCIFHNVVIDGMMNDGQMVHPHLSLFTGASIVHTFR